MRTPVPVITAALIVVATPAVARADVPVNLSPPSIATYASPLYAGDLLAEDVGVWTGATSFSEQWQRCDAAGQSCSDIPGAVYGGYYTTPADAGYTVRVEEIARNESGAAAPATSAPSEVIQPFAAPTNVTAPVISGKTTRGSVLTVTPGVWTGTEPITFDYEWRRCHPQCVAIPGATGTTYRITAADQDDSRNLRTLLAVVVTARNRRRDYVFGTHAVSNFFLPMTASRELVRRVARTLLATLTVSGRAARITQLLRHHGYATSFRAPSAGGLDISWSTRPRAGRVPVEVASARKKIKAAGTYRLKIKLTRDGRALLKRVRHLRVAITGVFVPGDRARASTTRAKKVTLR
jgi:hypothetical protein